jgi:uncharacterized repeat protein (TIGR02543 family)
MKRLAHILVAISLMVVLVGVTDCGAPIETPTPFPTTTPRVTLVPTLAPTSTPTATAMATPTTYILSITVTPSGAGSVSPSGGQYQESSQVTLTATPASGYTFDYWGGDASGSSATITITMDSDKNVIAHFSVVDIAPPVISEVNASKITESSATIAWITDEPATSQVEYGTTDAYGSTTPLDEELTTSHGVTLTELRSEITYHFRIKSADEAENEALSDGYTFTTKTTKELVSASLYSAITIGGYVHQLGFNLFNGSSQTIIVTRGEFFDKNGNSMHTISADDITRIWQSGSVETGKSFSGGISFRIPYSTEEIEGWQVKWYCLDATGAKFIVKGEHSPIPEAP